jgi:hypothetical protein
MGEWGGGGGWERGACAGVGQETSIKHGLEGVPVPGRRVEESLSYADTDTDTDTERACARNVLSTRSRSEQSTTTHQHVLVQKEKAKSALSNKR